MFTLDGLMDYIGWHVVDLKTMLYAKLSYINSKLILFYLSYYVVINNSWIIMILLHFFFRSIEHTMKTREIEAEVALEDWNMPLKFGRLYRWIQRGKFETGSACL